MSVGASPSLLVVIVDLTPTPWGERERIRQIQDEARFKENKRSIGPAKLEEVVSSVLSFVLAFAACHRENCGVVIGVADDEVAVLYPRKGGGMEGMVSGSSSEMGGAKVDPRALYEGVTLGMAELVGRAVRKIDMDANKQTDAAQPSHGSGTPAMAAATSLALCIINRFMVTAGGGVSALASGSADALSLHRRQDEGVLAIISSSAGGPPASSAKAKQRAAHDRQERRRARGMLSPRILILQASEDRTRDYNAFMNCAFAAVKSDVVIDACFVPSGIPHQSKTSVFLEQACDCTDGVFSKPIGAGQAGGALTEILMTVFLAPSGEGGIRNKLNLPGLNEVDFRARCFETGESVNMAFVCNQCLSIFKLKPIDSCLTCGAQIRPSAAPTTTTRENGNIASPNKKRNVGS